MQLRLILHFSPFFVVVDGDLEIFRLYVQRGDSLPTPPKKKKKQKSCAWTPARFSDIHFSPPTGYRTGLGREEEEEER